MISWYKRLAGDLPASKLTEVVSHLVSIEKHTLATKGSVIWKGPLGAQHMLSTNFWSRVARTHTMNHSCDDNCYIKYWGKGKYLRIPDSLLEEFRAHIVWQTERDLDHTTRWGTEGDPTYPEI